MKKIALVLMLVGVAFLVAGNVQDAGAGHSRGGCHSCHIVHHATPEEGTLASDVRANYGVPLWSQYAGYTDHDNDDATPDMPEFKNASGKTWDLYQPVIQYVPGVPSTLNATLEQPNGPTRLCLGCHDGTYDHVAGGQTEFTTLADMHPVSIKYIPGGPEEEMQAFDHTANIPLRPNATVANTLLDSRGRVQCTSCHDPHSQAIPDTPYLRWDITTDYRSGFFGEQLMCTACHIK